VNSPVSSGPISHDSLHFGSSLAALAPPATKSPQIGLLMGHASHSPHMNAAIPERRPATEEISGLIERVTFHNDESGYCVLRVKTQGHREETTVIWSLPSVTAGEWLVAEGWWVRDKEHGLQFKTSTMKTAPPTMVAGIDRYLSSGLVKGIGACSGEEAGRAVRRRGSRCYREPACRTAIGGRDRPQAPRADRACVVGGKASPRNHAVPAQPRREHQPSGADIQDLRRAGDRGAEQPSVTQPVLTRRKSRLRPAAFSRCAHRPCRGSPELCRRCRLEFLHR
jgi:hypothetical protein